MSQELLKEHISPLVDRLRAGEHMAISLPDVAAVTEILMRSLESYFKSIDLTIYQECQSLADYIDDARLEIASLSPEHSDSAKIPRAGLELAAIVDQTESATNTIMESAERIMEADPSGGDDFTATINDACMQIFEACSFQDITGQRISKVVTTLEHVEARVSKLINILGVLDNGQPITSPPEEEIDENKALLHGPALDGEGIDQDAVDDLINKNSPVEGTVDKDGPASSSAAHNGVNTPNSNAKPQNVVQPPASPAGGAVLESAGSDDIDFTFDGQSPDPEENISPPPVEAAVEVVEEVEENELNLIGRAKQRKADARAEQKASHKPSKPVVYEADSTAGLNPKATEKTTQSDIDALFS